MKLRRERAKLANPFTTMRVKDKTAEKDAEEAVYWKAKFSSFTAPQAGSTVAMAMARGRLGPQQHKWRRQRERRPKLQTRYSEQSILNCWYRRGEVALLGRVSIGPVCVVQSCCTHGYVFKF